MLARLKARSQVWDRRVGLGAVYTASFAPAATGLQLCDAPASAQDTAIAYRG